MESWLEDPGRFTDRCFREYLAYIHELTGITIHPNRKSMVLGRIRRRLRATGTPGFEEYLNLVRASEQERSVFIDCITTNETCFFRTPRIWEHLERRFLPDWAARNPGRVFRSWSAAAASGEEAGSIGILCEEFRGRARGFDYRILGTDVSDEMVSRCRTGVYEGRSVEQFRSARAIQFKRHLHTSGSGWRISEEIRGRMSFRWHHLFKELPNGLHFDLILLRNVLIYFSRADQEKVVELAASRLLPGGVLVIGESESLSHIRCSLRPVAPLFYVRDLRGSAER